MNDCTVLVSNDQQCPLAAIERQQNECIELAFSGDEWYSDSADELCKYVCVSFVFFSAKKKMVSERNFKEFCRIKRLP